LQDAGKSDRKLRQHKDRNSDRSRTTGDSKDRTKRRGKRDSDQNKPVLNDLEEFLGRGDTVTSSSGPYESL